VFSASLFVVIRGVFGTDLMARSRPESERLLPTKVLRTIGDATLGVFGLHLMMIEFSLELPWIGGEHIASSSIQLIARISFIVIVTFAVVVPLRRVPVLGRVL
jgi:peptidoglycan/LPS O-acetylase OafA/YrhL